MYRTYAFSMGGYNLICHWRTQLLQDDKLTNVMIVLAHQLLSGLEQGVYFPVPAHCGTNLNHISTSHACMLICIILARKPARSIMHTICSTRSRAHVGARARSFVHWKIPNFSFMITLRTARCFKFWVLSKIWQIPQTLLVHVVIVAVLCWLTNSFTLIAVEPTADSDWNMCLKVASCQPVCATICLSVNLPVCQSVCLCLAGRLLIQPLTPGIYCANAVKTASPGKSWLLN